MSPKKNPESVTPIEDLEHWIATYPAPKRYRDDAGHVWSAKGAHVVDSGGKLLAVCASPQLARQMAQAQRALAHMFIEADAYALGYSLDRGGGYTSLVAFWQPVCETLQNAGEDREKILAKVMERAKRFDEERAYYAKPHPPLDTDEDGRRTLQTVLVMLSACEKTLQELAAAPEPAGQEGQASNG